MRVTRWVSSRPIGIELIAITNVAIRAAALKSL